MKFVAGLLILLVALALQFWFLSLGSRFDLTLAALISFAFLFEFWELVVFTLAAVFILNWQPAASLEIVVFALLPFAAYFFHKIIPWEAWIGNLVAIFVGFFLLYLIVSPQILIANPWPFVFDVISGLIFGMLVFFPMHEWYRR